MKTDFVKNTNTPYRKYIIALSQLDKEYDFKRNALKEELHDAQLTCKHEKTTYYPDPSGNNDSWTECNICGKEL